MWCRNDRQRHVCIPESLSSRNKGIHYLSGLWDDNLPYISDGFVVSDGAAPYVARHC